MTGNAHRVVGGVVGAGCYLGSCRVFKREPTVGEFLLAVGAGVLMASLPDLIEPAIHPNHRAFFHSTVFNGFLIFALKQAWIGQQSPEEKIAVTTLGFAWLSHPCLDALTPKGLPII